MEPESFFKALTDPTRLRCVCLLVDHQELCVCELTHALALPQPKISHHLGALRKTELVSDRKQGLWIYYRINPALPKWVIDVLQTTVKGVREEVTFANDAVALSEMPNRPGGICSA